MFFLFEYFFPIINFFLNKQNKQNKHCTRNQGVLIQMKIKSKEKKKQRSKFALRFEEDKINKLRAERNGVQYEFTPTSIQLWECDKHEKKQLQQIRKTDCIQNKISAG